MPSIPLPPKGDMAPLELTKPSWNLFIILSGPGGIGKGTVGRELRAQRPELKLIPSATTRDPDERDNPGEYVYCDDTEFLEHWQQGHLLEASEHMDNWYGQMAPSLDTLGISDIDVNGSQRMFKAGLPRLLRIGLIPYGETMEEQIEVCVSRMRGRGSSQATINKRRERAEYEIHTILSRWPLDPDALIIVNIDLEETVATINQHITERLAPTGPI